MANDISLKIDGIKDNLQHRRMGSTNQHWFLLGYGAKIAPNPSYASIPVKCFQNVTRIFRKMWIALHAPTKNLLVPACPA